MSNPRLHAAQVNALDTFLFAQKCPFDKTFPSAYLSMAAGINTIDTTMFTFHFTNLLSTHISRKNKSGKTEDGGESNKH